MMLAFNSNKLKYKVLLVILAIFLLPFKARASGSDIFRSSVFAVDTPLFTAVGDFNGDGKLDLAVVNNGDNTVSIMLGNGDGTFGSTIAYAVGSSPQKIVTLDFNGDGKLDLAVTDFGGNNILVLLGNGDGTFRSAASYTAGSSPFSITAGDFNHDSKIDLAVTNNISNNISILLSNGDGTFQSAVNYTVGNGPLGITTTDFNGDGKPDLALTNQSDSDVSILLNQFSSSVSSPTPPPQGSLPVFISPIVSPPTVSAPPVSATTSSPNNNSTSPVSVIPVPTSAVAVTPVVCPTGDIFSFITGKPCTVFQNPVAPTTNINANNKSSCAITTTLSLWSRGEQVKCLQTILPNLLADGIFGPKTYKAVTLFQQEHNLAPDGVVGSKTRAALFN